MSPATEQQPPHAPPSPASRGPGGSFGLTLAPLGVLVASLAGLGMLGYALWTDGSGRWFAARGLGVPDAIGALGAAGICLLALGAASLAAFGRQRTLLRIRAALSAFAKGERQSGALAVPHDSATAEAWNRLVAWQESAAETAEAGLLVRAGAAGGGGAGSQISNRAADAIWHGVVIIDEHQIIRYANGAAAVFLRHRRDVLLGVDIKRAITDTAVLEAIGMAATTGSRQKRSMDVGDASVPDASVLRFSVRALGQADDRSVLIVIEDVTQQRISDAVQHAFIAQAAHELRTPLTNISLYTEQLMEESLSGEERSTALNVINQEIGRLDHIVADMLSIAEIEAGRLSAHRGEVRVEPMFEQLRHDYAESAAKKGLTLSFELPPKFPPIWGDRDKISIVLHNLLGNAIKYTPSGGSVRVSVRVEGDRFVTEVSDTGIGIGEEDSQRIFERFARGNDPRARAEVGSGLGLALARDIARLHEGDISLQSELDVGSTFSFWLPIATTSSSAQAA